MERRHSLTLLTVTLITVSLLLFNVASSPPQVKVYLDPPSINVKPGEEFILSIKVDPGDYGVSGGEINLAFNPSSFNVVEISPGDLFGSDPLVGFEEVKNDVGTVKYALARKGTTTPPTPPGVFAKITFKVLTEAKPGSYKIILTFVGLADQDFKDVPKEEISLTNSSVEVAGAIPGPILAGDISPKVLREGEDASLSLTFVNKGEGEARQVSLSMEAPGFTIVSGGGSSPNIPPGGYGSAVFTLRPLEGGYKTVRVTITYSDIIGNTYTNTIQYPNLLVLVRFKVYSQDKDGNILRIPMVINGETHAIYEEWIDPTKDITIEAPRIVEKENIPYISNIRYVFKQWNDGNTALQRKVSLTKSSTLIAVYRVEYPLTYIAYATIIVAAVLAVGISLLLFLKKKPKKAPPPPPPPPS